MMMLELGKIYRRNSMPLEEVKEPGVDDIYYNEEGHALKYLGNDEFEFITRSPLVPDELISELTRKQLYLFWKLAKNGI